MIECRGVSGRAGNFWLRDVTFTVPLNAHAVLTGPTASGKTTLLELIAGRSPIAAGEIRIGDSDVTTHPPESRGVGLVPQHGLLFPHLDVRRNIEYGSATSGEAALLARHFGVEHLLERATGELSGGERQLVALCRALAARPHVLLMDEPVSALDPRRRNDVLSRFAALRAERSITVLHVTHVESRMPHETLHLEMIDGTVSVATTGSY